MYGIRNHIRLITMVYGVPCNVSPIDSWKNPSNAGLAKSFRMGFKMGSETMPLSRMADGHKIEMC